jgi:enoyl-CoA hydratase
MAAYDYRTLLVSKEGNVAIVTLNRPEVLNAVDEVMHSELVGLWPALAADPEVDAIVITGAGRAFSAGGDMRWMQSTIQRSFLGQRQTMREALDILENMLRVEQPIVAAVNGPATGLGATLALFCDIIVMSEMARIGDTHVRAGVVAGDGGTVIWPLLVGIHRAKEYLMTGDLIDGREAERLGLVNKVVPPEELMPTALAYARRLAAGARWAVRWTKMALNQWLRWGLTLTQPAAVALEMLTFNTDDHREAVQAFLAKRQPQFQGR